MTNSKPGKPRTTFSDEEARTILEHAAVLDSSLATSFSATDLRRAAAEASIHPAAIDAALAGTAGPTRGSSLRPTSLKGLGFLGLGAILGALAVTADQMSLGPEAAAAVFGPSAGFALYRALWNRWHGSIADFVREIGIFFGSFTIAATLIEGSQATGPALFWSIGCALVGAGIVTVELRSAARSANVSLNPENTSQHPGA